MCLVIELKKKRKKQLHLCGGGRRAASGAVRGGREGLGDLRRPLGAGRRVRLGGGGGRGRRRLRLLLLGGLDGAHVLARLGGVGGRFARRAVGSVAACLLSISEKSFLSLSLI